MPVVLKTCKLVTVKYFNVYIVKVKDSSLLFPTLQFSIFNTTND